MFNAADDASIWGRQAEAEIESAASGAEGQYVEGTRIHIYFCFRIFPRM